MSGIVSGGLLHGMVGAEFELDADAGVGISCPNGSNQGYFMCFRTFFADFQGSEAENECFGVSGQGVGASS